MSKKSNEIVIDLETQKTFDEVGGRNMHLLRVSVAGIYSYEKDNFQIFTEADIGNLLPILESANRVIGFNIRRFDYPVLEPYFKKDLNVLPTLDIMEDIQRRLGHRLSLQSLASATLNEGKIGSGLDAVYFFREGKMDRLIEYCKADVRLTRDLYEYGRAHGHLLYPVRRPCPSGHTPADSKHLIGFKPPLKPSNGAYRKNFGLEHITVSWR